jgi:putative transcriptional regulator
MNIISTGQELRSWRKAQGFNQPQFASFMGVSLKTVQSWERSEQIPMNVTFRLLDLIVYEK